MNLQRREEIRELIAEIARYEELGATLDLEGKARDAITELLAHIDALEQAAAERVIARGAVIAPHTFGEIINQVRDIAIQHAGTEQLREQIAYALAPHFERDAGPTPDYTGEGSAWVPPTPVTDAALVEVRSWIHAVGPVGAMVWVDPQEVLKAAGVRVLGEGMVQISGRELACMRAELEYRRAESDEAPDSVLDPLWDAFNALRANQGGAAT